MIQALQQLAVAVSNQTQLTESIKDKLDELEIGGGIAEIPPATSSTIGGIKVGSGLNVTSDGTLSTDGGGPVGPIYAVNVIYDNTTSGTDVTNVQASLDEIYALIGDVNTTLGNIL